MKGELEHQLKSLPYKSLTIVRPSILVGQRDKARHFERAAAFFSLAAPRRFRAVKATDVAASVVAAAVADQIGVRMISSASLAGVSTGGNALPTSNAAVSVAG
jgi:hypothetical protein